jgi:transposase
MSKERDWAAEVEAWRASGLSARQYCEEREYSATTLYWWSSNLKRAGSASEPKKSVRLARVVRKRSARPAPRTTPIVVQIGQARVEVGADADRDALSVVLEALAATAWGERS